MHRNLRQGMPLIQELKYKGKQLFPPCSKRKKTTTAALSDNFPYSACRLMYHSWKPASLQCQTRGDQVQVSSVQHGCLQGPAAKHKAPPLSRPPIVSCIKMEGNHCWVIQMGQENNLQAGGRGGRSNLQAGGQLSDGFQRQSTQEKKFLKTSFKKNLVSIVVKYSSSELHGLPRGEDFPPLARVNINADKWQAPKAQAGALQGAGSPLHAYVPRLNSHMESLMSDKGWVHTAGFLLQRPLYSLLSLHGLLATALLWDLCFSVKRDWSRTKEFKRWMVQTPTLFL